jgi:hypothetical protein
VIRGVVSLVALLALAVPASAANSPSAVSFSILGRWKGTLHQRGLSPFVVTARIRGFDALSRNTVHYAGIDCSGHWTYLTRKAGAYQFREVITTGRSGKCKGVGRVTLTRIDPNHVRYVFRGGGVVSRGVLRRL